MFPRSTKFRASVQADVDDKKGECEAVFPVAHMY